MKILLTLLILVTPLFSQDTFWVLLGEHDGWAYHANTTSDKKVGETKMVKLTGEFRSYYVKQKWEISCKEDTVREVYRSLYTPENELLTESKEYDSVHPVEKGSFADHSLSIWCDRNPSE